MTIDAMTAIIHDLCGTDPFFEQSCIYCHAPEYQRGKINRRTHTRERARITNRDEHSETCVWRRALDVSDALHSPPPEGAPVKIETYWAVYPGAPIPVRKVVERGDVRCQPPSRRSAP